jgi:hypothetical protein
MSHQKTYTKLEGTQLYVGFNGEPEPGSHTGSYISWENESMMPAIRQMFNAKPHEEIVGIQVSPEGIKALFQRR